MLKVCGNTLFCGWSNVMPTIRKGSFVFTHRTLAAKYAVACEEYGLTVTVRARGRVVIAE